MTKNVGKVSFFVFLAVFIVLSYFVKNGALGTLLSNPSALFKSSPKKTIVEMEFTDKEYTANYSTTYKDWATELSNFEQKEKWSGNFGVDKDIFVEGEAGYSFISKNRQATTIFLKRTFDLSERNVIKMFVYIKGDKDINNLEKLNLRFGTSSDSDYYEYPITNLISGWNYITMDVKNFGFVGKKANKTDDSSSSTVRQNDDLWKHIEKITFELVSRPDTEVTLTLDRLWAEKDESYKDDFYGSILSLISARNYEGKFYINLWPFNSTTAYIKKVTSAKNFTYTAKLIPQQKGSFGVIARSDSNNNYGYYFIMNGIDSGDWQLNKLSKLAGTGGTNLDLGTITNYAVEQNKPLWLRIKISEDTINLYLSVDGSNFTHLTEKKDSELKAGGIGLITNPSASFLVETIDFKQ